MKSQHLQDSTFFMLTPGVRDRLMEIKLTAAEWRMWCYLVSLDPFGDRGAKFSPAELMLKCKIKKTTYFSAKAKFQKLGLFDFRDGVTKVVNLQTSLIQTASEHPQAAKIIESEISESQSEISESQSEISEFKSEISEFKSEISEFKSEISDNQSLKPKLHNVSKSPQTIQIYSDFKDSLSENERENFFNFVKEKTNNLERPINDLEAWLASKNAAKQNRWEIYYRSYQEEQINEGRKTTRHSENGRKLSPSKMQQAIAEFKKQRQINQPVDEPENVSSESRLSSQNRTIQEGLAPNTTEEYHYSAAEVNKLLDNPPELGKSRAQTHRERIAEVKRQQAEIRRVNREAAESRAKQQNPDLEQRKLETLRQIEEMNQLQSSQNSDPDESDGKDE
jgi:hypothetical protein